MINTIYIISIIALLILTLQNSAHLNLEIINDLEKSHQEWHILEKTAQDILNDISTEKLSKECILENNQEPPEYNDIIQDGCNSNKNTIKYFIKDLGDFVCLRTIIAGKGYATHHYQLYIASKKQPSKVLEVRYAMSSIDIPCRDMRQRYISPGILSWLISNITI